MSGADIKQAAKSQFYLTEKLYLRTIRLKNWWISLWIYPWNQPYESVLSFIPNTKRLCFENPWVLLAKSLEFAIKAQTNKNLFNFRSRNSASMGKVDLHMVFITQKSKSKPQKQEVCTVISIALQLNLIGHDMVVTSITISI